MKKIITAQSVEQTRAFGATIASQARAGDVYALNGDLGTGKTEFVRGFVLSLDPSARITSPTFSIVNIYTTPRFPVYHFDFYRLGDSSELTEIGFDEYIGGDGVCLIEWASMFRGILPENTKVLTFSDISEFERTIEFEDWN